jgi:hypothetical protein
MCEAYCALRSGVPVSDIRDVVVPLYERRGPNWKGLGTASIIIVGDRCAVAITARHVLEALVDEKESNRPAYPKLSGVGAIIGSFENSFIAEVLQIQISKFSDISFVFLVAPEGRGFNARLSIDPSPLTKGVPVTAMGYRGLPVEHDIDWENDYFGARFEFRLDTIETQVAERFVSGLRMLKWPVFKVSAGFDSGMSGGPVIEIRQGELVIRGIICSDLSIGNDLGKGGGGEAFASEIWPILMMPYQFDTNFTEDNGHTVQVGTIFDLFKNDFVIDRGDTIKNFRWEIREENIHAAWFGFPEILLTPRYS